MSIDRRYGARMRLGLVPFVVMLSLLSAAPSAIADDDPTEAAISKGKKKAKKCKKAKAALTINGRKRCVPLKAALPLPRGADARLLVAEAALGAEVGPVRDRRGRPAVSMAKLLGHRRIHTAEAAITKGLTTLDRLRASTALSSSSSPFATASAVRCTGKVENDGDSAEFKGNGFDAKVDLGKNSAQIGVDLGDGGFRAEIDFGLCDGTEEKFKAPDCPDAEGTLEASDESSYYVNMRVFKGAELLVSQNLDFSSDTAIKPIQVDQDAKLEFFEIDHTYKTSIVVGGSSQQFGPISLKIAYHGGTRVNYPGATYDPTHTDVEVKFNLEGAQADELHEVRDVEFDQSLQAKQEADKNFAAEVDKAIKKLGEKEQHWNRPNACVEMKFDPVSNSLTFEKDQAGGFRPRIESRGGGAPDGAKWTLDERHNATVTPAKALANPASFSYTVTNAGKGVEVEASFTAVSRAGVAAGTWTQPTKDPPPPTPPPAEMFTGTISGTSDYDGDELGAGNSLSAQWSGEVALKQDPPFEQPGVPVSNYTYKLISGSIVYSFAGTVNECHVEGSGPIDLGAQFELTAGVSMILYDESPRTYQLILPSPLLVKVDGTTSDCADPEDNGHDFDWPPGAGVSTLAYSPKGDQVDQDWAFSGSGAGDNGPGSPDETWHWNFVPAP